MRKTSLLIFIALLLIIFAKEAQSSTKESHSYDLIVVGAGTGGCSAAIQAARLGLSVALMEESNYVGGQMTGAAVSTMDDKTKTRTGIYLEFITKIKEYYDAQNTKINVCYWGSDTISFDPWVGQMILKKMIAEAGKVDLFLETTAVSAELAENRVSSALFSVKGEKMKFKAKIFIDATECGDFIPLTKARYRSGNSISPLISNTNIIQNITYPAVVKRYKDGLPKELIVQGKPPRYDEYLPHFRKVITKDGDSWPGEYPFNISTHNAYRAIPDVTNKKYIDGGVPETWSNITKTAINWANDYPGDDSGLPGMSVEFLESPNYRLQSSRQAMAKTLAFLYYMQTELGMTDWSVDTEQGYGEWFSNDWKEWSDMPEKYTPILSHFPPFPYVRESRRIVGVKTMTVYDVKRDNKLGRTLKSIPDSIALGEYPVDIHGQNKNSYLESDLGETADKIPNDWKDNDGGLFQIPMAVLIPEKIDGLLAAEKNISVSRVVNGATRLQPVTMLTGQAAGALAAVAIKNRVQPRDLRPFDVQYELLKEKSQLSLFNFKDVPTYSSHWAGVEAAVLYEYMTPQSERIFGSYEKTTWDEIKDVIKKAMNIAELPETNAEYNVSVDTFAEWLRAVFKEDLKKYESVLENFVGEKPMTRGKLASAIMEIKRVTPRFKDLKEKTM